MNQVFIPLNRQLKVLKEAWLVPDDMRIKRLLEVMWDAPKIGQFMTWIQNGDLKVYETPNASLIIIELVDWSKGRELSIYGMVGRDIIDPRFADEIVNDLKKLAFYFGCSMIGGVGVPTAWRRAAPRLGFKPVSTHYVMELNDGR